MMTDMFPLCSILRPRGRCFYMLGWCKWHAFWYLNFLSPPPLGRRLRSAALFKVSAPEPAGGGKLALWRFRLLSLGGASGDSPAQYFRGGELERRGRRSFYWLFIYDYMCIAVAVNMPRPESGLSGDRRGGIVAQLRMMAACSMGNAATAGSCCHGCSWLDLP